MPAAAWALVLFGSAALGLASAAAQPASSAPRSAVLRAADPGLNWAPLALRREETALRRRSFRQRRAADPWLAPDKAKHLGASFLLTLSGQYVLTSKLPFSERGALPLSIAGAALVGLGKEVYDWKVKPSHHFCRRDLVADGLGIALAAGLILL